MSSSPSSAPPPPSSTPTTTNNNNNNKPLTIGVFGGSFNPIHLGHALLAITTQQTKNVDKVVLVPVFKHAVKRDLLPYADRVQMCQLAIGGSAKIEVSTVEQETGESNGAMLKALKQKYPSGSKFLWICGDDFFRWMDKPKGLETLREVDGLIVQRRLHKQEDSSDMRFYKEPLDTQKMSSVQSQLNLEIDFIYGELPHFSSTLVRRAPGHWKSFLPQTVSEYLDGRQHLLEQLHRNLEADAQTEAAASAASSRPLASPQTKKARTTTPSVDTSTTTPSTTAAAAACVLFGLEAVHALQRERGRTGLVLSMGRTAPSLNSKEKTQEAQLKEAQAHTDQLLRDIGASPHQSSWETEKGEEVAGLAAELQQIHVWLARDRRTLDKRCHVLQEQPGAHGWVGRLALVEKFNPRIDVLIFGIIRALTEILESSSNESAAAAAAGSPNRELPDLLWKWCEGKEALGRLRAFVCAGGPQAPAILKTSLEMRQRLNQRIDTKEKCIARVLALEADISSSTRRLAAPEALYKMLEEVTLWEWSLMGCFAASTPLPLVHKLLALQQQQPQDDDPRRVEKFDVEKFFEASSSAIDFLLTFAKALTASGCAGA